MAVDRIGRGRTESFISGSPKSCGKESPLIRVCSASDLGTVRILRGFRAFRAFRDGDRCRNTSSRFGNRVPHDARKKRNFLDDHMIESGKIVLFVLVPTRGSTKDSFEVGSCGSSVRCDVAEETR